MEYVYLFPPRYINLSRKIYISRWKEIYIPPTKTKNSPKGNFTKLDCDKFRIWFSFSSYELSFIQRIVYSYTSANRIISPFSPFYQISSNKKLFPRFNFQVPIMLSPGEVIIMTGYSPFLGNLDIFIHNNPFGNPNESGGNNNTSTNKQENNNTNKNNS